MRKLLILFIFILGYQLSYSQNFNLNATTSVNVDCTTGGMLFDSGGTAGDYADNQSFVYTVCPGSPGFGVFASMLVMDIAVGDELTIYNGNSTAATAFPDMPLDNSTSYNVNAQFQATVTNPTGCLTFEFVSNGDGTLGSFQFELDCEARCQEVLSDILFSDPDTTWEGGELFINICPGDSLNITGTALYPDNNTEYAQSNATSEFSWNWGDNSPMDTGITLGHYYPAPGGYLLNLSVVDVNGCRNFQDQIIKVRVAPEPEFVELIDTFMCLGELDTLSALPQGTVINGSVVQGTSEFFSPPFFSGDSLFLPDGNGAGYDSDAFLTSFGNGDVVTNCGDILEVCVTMEHSYLGDLEITLICPNGQSAVLKSFSSGGGSTFLGNPWDDPSTQSGNGLEYCFSPLGTTTLVNGPTQAATNDAGNTVQPGLYASEDPFTNFIGCPLNGQWTLNITDNIGYDDGYLFNWELNLDPCLFPEIDSFTMLYNFGFWQNDPTINGIVNGNANTIEIEPDTTGLFTYHYTTADQFGCIFEKEYDIYVDGFDVVASPDSSTICAGEVAQLNAAVEGVVTACEPDYFTYPIAYTKEIATGAATPIVFSQANDGVSPSIPLPFPFEFYCQSQSQVRVTSNGYLSFANSGISIAANGVIPTPGVPSNMVALMWDDLIDSANVSNYFTIGTAPDRKFVVELDLLHVGGTSNSEPVQGQIILHETTNIIDVLCENCQQDASDPTATQGVENNIGLVGTAATGRNNSAWSATQDAMRFYPQSSLNTDYTILWSPTTGLTGETTQAPVANPSINTDYIVEITNANNCSYSDTVSVIVGGNYAHQISPDTLLCLGESVQLEVTGGAESILWSPDDGSISDVTIFNPIFTPDTTTTYRAEVDSAGCTAYDYVTITVSELVVDSTIVNLETCAGDADASIEIFASGGFSPQYSIDGGLSFTSTSLFANLAADTYDIVVNDNGRCDTSYQVVIIGGVPIQFDSIVLIDPLCGIVNDGSILVHTSSGIAPYTYSIDNGLNMQDSLVFNNLAGGQYQVVLTDSLGCSVDSIVTISQPDSLILGTVQVDSLSCFDTNDGSVEVLATGGVGAYEYSEDNVTYSAVSTFGSLASGTHTIYVRDANLCVDSLEATVYAPDSISLTIDSTDITCKDLDNGTATVTVSGGTPGYTYSWNDPATQTVASAINLAPGNYQVLVTDANSCQATIATSVSEPDSLILTVDSFLNVLCNGQTSASISVSTEGGVMAYNYSWSNGSTTEDLSNVGAGNYTLTVTDANGCTDQVSQSLSEPIALSSSLLGTNITCFNGVDGAIDATISGGVGTYDYSWTGPNGFVATSEDIAGLLAGLYTLVVTDSNNCTITDTLTIIEPTVLVVDFAATDVACFGGNDGSLTVSVVSGGTAPFSFQWDAAANNQTGVSANGLSVGSYQVTITDDNSCTTTFNSLVNQPDSALTISLSGTDITCAGADDGTVAVVALGGTPGYTYLWNDPQGQTTLQAIDLSANTYQATVTDANGCIESDTITIVEPDAIQVFMVADSANCWGESSGSINVTATGGTGIGYAFSIDGGETFQNGNDFFDLPAGVYNEIVVLDLGSNVTCLSDVFTTTVYEQPYFSFVVAPNDTTLQLEESAMLSLVITSPAYTDADIASVTWYPTTGLDCSDCIMPTVLTYDHYTEYTATVNYYGDDDALCNANSNTIIIVENNLELFIPNAFTPGNFDNTNNVFEVYGEGIEFVTMQIYNRWGEKIFESANQKVTWDGTFKGEMQQPGVYTYYVSVEYLDAKTISRKGSVTLIR